MEPGKVRNGIYIDSSNCTAQSSERTVTYHTDSLTYLKDVVFHGTLDSSLTTCQFVALGVLKRGKNRTLAHMQDEHTHQIEPAHQQEQGQARQDDATLPGIPQQ